MTLLTGVILAGNVRLGTGKSGQKNGMELVKEHAGRMRKVCSEIIISTNEPRPFLELFGNQVRIVTDFFKGKGALAGIHAAMSLASNELIWLVDGELPTISIRVASLLLEERNKEDWDAAIPSVQQGVQPYHGIYKKGCAQKAADLLQKGDRSVVSLLDSIRYTTVSQEAFVRRGVRPENYQKLMKLPVF